MIAVSRRAFLGFSTLLALAGTRLKALAAEVGAQVTEIVNTVTAKAKDTEHPVPVEPGDAIAPDTEIATTKESGVEVTYADTTVLIIGQRAKATVMTAESSALLTTGAFRFRGLNETATLTSPLLRIDARQAEFVVAVAEGQTICGVVTGEITCTSLKKGTSSVVPAGQSIAWVSGSFGDGPTDGVYKTGDIAVDDGLVAARAAWAPPVVAPPPP